MNGEQNQNNKVQFNSSDIGKKKRPDYFAGRIKKNPIKDFIKYAFAGKQKFITIGIIAAVVIAIITFILWLTVWSQVASDTGGTDNSGGGWNKQLADMENEANAIFNSDSESSFIEAVNHFDTQIKEEKDSHRSFDLRISRAAFLNNNGGAQMAIDDLTTINESDLSDQQRYDLYLSLEFAYRQIDDEEYAKIYDKKVNKLPSSVTSIGG